MFLHQPIYLTRLQQMNQGGIHLLRVPSQRDSLPEEQPIAESVVTKNLPL